MIMKAGDLICYYRMNFIYMGWINNFEPSNRYYWMPSIEDHIPTVHLLNRQDVIGLFWKRIR